MHLVIYINQPPLIAVVGLLPLAISIVLTYRAVRRYDISFYKVPFEVRCLKFFFSTFFDKRWFLTNKKSGKDK